MNRRKVNYNYKNTSKLYHKMAYFFLALKILIFSVYVSRLTPVSRCAGRSSAKAGSLLDHRRLVAKAGLTLSVSLLWSLVLYQKSNTTKLSLLRSSLIPPLTSYVSRLTSHVLRLTSYVSRLTSHVSRLTSHVSRLTSYVSRLTFYVLRLTSYVLRLTSYIM
jgi:hypothetical protein